MIYLIAGLALISGGAFLLWASLLSVFLNVAAGVGVRDNAKARNWEYSTPWYMHYLPFFLIPAGIVLLVLR